MRVLGHRLHKPHGRAWLAIGLALVSVGVIGGGVYAKLGGVPNTISTDSISLQKGLLGWWKLNGNAYDSTPYAENGVVTGASLTTDRKGLTNSAYSFNGTSNYISVTPWAQLTGAAPRTQSIWFKTSSSANQTLMEFGAGPNGTASILQIYSTSIRIDANACAASTSSTPYTNGSWHQIIATYDGTTFKLYMDGQYITSSACTLNTTSTDLRIGSLDAYVGGGRYFSGSLSDARVYNRVLSTNEISALYNQYNSSLKTDTGAKGLVGWWKLAGNAYDATPNANNGTITSATLTTDRKGASNAAYSFNGTSSVIVMTNESKYIAGSSTITINGWVKPPNNPAASMGYFGIRNDANADFYILQVSATDNLECRFMNSGGTIYQAGSVTVTPNVWQMVTLVYTGSAVTCYVNAVVQPLPVAQ
jgi:hypothetical protein